MAVTLKEIAAQVGVSTQLVSAVLRGSTAGRVSPEKYDRIMKVVAQTNYRPNHLAKALKEKKTMTLGFINGDIDSPFHSSLSAEMLKAARRYGYKLMLMVSDWDRDLDLSCLEQLLDYQVDGIVMNGFAMRREDALCSWLIESRKPFVQIVGNIAELPNILIDFHSGMQAAFELLLRTGHRQIAIADAPGVKTAAYKQLCEQYRLMPMYYNYELPYWAGYDQIVECGRRIGGSAVRPDALIIGSDECAGLIINGMAECGVKVPDDISVISNDNTYANRMIRPPLTVIELSRKKVADLAISCLMEQIESPESFQRKDLTVSTELIIRSSVIDRRIEKLN